MAHVSRRRMLKTSGAAMLTAGLPLEIAQTAEHAAAIAAAAPPVGATTPPITDVFFSTEDAACIEAAVSRLIPADEQWPGALEAAVPNDIDQQLAGAWGRGERLYRRGPWPQGTPSQGYQWPFTPAELFHTALAASNQALAKAGTPFATMSPDQQEASLRSLEAGGKDLDGVPSGLFFGALWAFTVEGFFSDPVYGGNRDMVAWRMSGCPGAYASSDDLVDRHGITIDRPPMSLAEDAHGHVHMHPGIRAHSPSLEWSRPMVQRRKPVDVVTIGVGLTGCLAALELADTGLQVVGLERGAPRDTVPDFQSPAIHDERRFSIRQAMRQDHVKVAVSFRHNADQTALPVRRWESFLPGQGLGGSCVPWHGQSFRFQVADFIYRTHILARDGQTFLDACGPELTIQEWGVTDDELAPHDDRFEDLCGVSGKAGNIKGQIPPGGNPFEAPRSREYPNPPLQEPSFGAIFRQGAERLGDHPSPQPSANLSRPSTNPLGLQLQPCGFCGFCERSAGEHDAKASPQTIILPVLLKNPHDELRTSCEVLRLNLDSTRKKATGVTYGDAAGREFEPPAELVLMTAFPLDNVRTLLRSRIGKPDDPKTGEGGVGRNDSDQTTGGATVFMDERININPFMASGAPGTMIDDFGGDHFAHSPLGFIGGQSVGAIMTNGRPIEFHPTPPGTPKWGLEWKRAVARHDNHTILIQQHGTATASRLNDLDLDPTYKDAWGQPLLRMTFDVPANDIRMSQYFADTEGLKRCRSTKHISLPPIDQSLSLPRSERTKRPRRSGTDRSARSSSPASPWRCSSWAGWHAITSSSCREVPWAELPSDPLQRPLPDGIVPEPMVIRTEKRWLMVMAALLVVMMAVIVVTGVTGALPPASHVEVIDPQTRHLGGEFVERHLGTALEPDGSATVRLMAEQYDVVPRCVRVPADTPVKFLLTSADVVHGFLRPATNVNTMVVPGFVGEVRTRFARAGEDAMPCHEFCGLGHHAMWAHVSVVPKDRFPAPNPRDRTSWAPE